MVMILGPAVSRTPHRWLCYLPMSMRSGLVLGGDCGVEDSRMELEVGWVYCGEGSAELALEFAVMLGDRIFPTLPLSTILYWIYQLQHVCSAGQRQERTISSPSGLVLWLWLLMRRCRSRMRAHCGLAWSVCQGDCLQALNSAACNVIAARAGSQSNSAQSDAHGTLLRGAA